MMYRSPVFSLFVGMMFLLVTTLVGIAEARGGRGGGGGFSRSSAASGGSFSSRSGMQRSPQSVNRDAGFSQRSNQQGNRQDGALERQGQRQDGAGNQRGDRTDNASERQGQRQEASGWTIGDGEDARNEAREDRQQHQNENREDWQDFAEDEWDDHHYHGYNTGAAFVAGAAVGAAAASPTYVSTLPCDGTMVGINGVNYYQCGSTWYRRGNQGGSVVYIVDSAPPGL